MKKILLFMLLSVLIYSSYEIKEGKVYYEGKLIKGVNVKRFIVLSSVIAYDDKSLYLEENLVDRNETIKIEKMIMCSAPQEIIYNIPSCNPYIIYYNKDKVFYYSSQERDENKQYFIDFKNLLNIMKLLDYRINIKSEIINELNKKIEIEYEIKKE